MLISGPSLLDWGRRAAATVMAVGAGRWYRNAGGHAGQGDQPRSAGARPAVGTPASTATGESPGAPSSGQLPPQQRLAPSRPTPAPVRAAVVRVWAHAQGLPVADRGPVPGWVMDQYLAQRGRPASERHTTAPTAPTRRTPPNVLGRLTLTWPPAGQQEEHLLTGIFVCLPAAQVAAWVGTAALRLAETAWPLTTATSST